MSKRKPTLRQRGGVEISKRNMDKLDAFANELKPEKQTAIVDNPNATVYAIGDCEGAI